jgi:hypothetical protein
VHPVGEPEGLRGPWRQQQRPGQGAVRCSGGISFTSALTAPSRSTFGDLLEGSSRHVLRGPPYDAPLRRAAGILRFQLQGPTTASPPRTPCEGRGQGPDPRRNETTAGRLLPAGLVHRGGRIVSKLTYSIDQQRLHPCALRAGGDWSGLCDDPPPIKKRQVGAPTTACCVSGPAWKV